jgi:spore germination protein KC
VLRNDELIIFVEINAQTVIQEVTSSFPVDKEIKKLEDAQNQAVVREVQSVLDKAQKQLQVDAFGFGEAVHREYPRQWQQMKSDWDEIFPGIQVQLEVKTKIVGTNLTSRPVDVGSD